MGDTLQGVEGDDETQPGKGVDLAWNARVSRFTVVVDVLWGKRGEEGGEGGREGGREGQIIGKEEGREGGELGGRRREEGGRREERDEIRREEGGKREKRGGGRRREEGEGLGEIRSKRSEAHQLKLTLYRITNSVFSHGAWRCVGRQPSPYPGPPFPCLPSGWCFLKSSTVGAAEQLSRCRMKGRSPLVRPKSMLWSSTCGLPWKQRSQMASSLTIEVFLYCPKQVS